MLSRILTEFLSLYDTAVSNRTHANPVTTKVKDGVSWFFGYNSSSVTFPSKKEFLERFDAAEKSGQGWVDIICDLGHKGHETQLTSGTGTLSEFTVVVNAARSFLLYIAVHAQDDAHKLWDILREYPRVREIAKIIQAEREQRINVIHDTIKLKHLLLQRLNAERLSKDKKEMNPTDVIKLPAKNVDQEKQTAEETIVALQQFLCYLNDTSFLKDENDERIQHIFAGHIMGGKYLKTDEHDISQLDVSRHVILQQNLYAIAIRRHMTDLRKTRHDLGVITTFVSNLQTTQLKELKESVTAPLEKSKEEGADNQEIDQKLSKYPRRPPSLTYLTSSDTLTPSSPTKEKKEKPDNTLFGSKTKKDVEQSKEKQRRSITPTSTSPRV